MKIAAIIAILVTVLLATCVSYEPASATHKIEVTTEPIWKLLIGSAFAVSWITFVLISVICPFYIDRKKVAEAEYWLPVGYTFPPRKFLKERGQILATIRFYALILSGVLLLATLATSP